MPKKEFKKGDLVRLNDKHSDHRPAHVKCSFRGGVGLKEQREGFFTWNEGDLILIEPATFTISILIGNSDDKLTQAEWYDYQRDVDAIVKAQPYKKLHFAGSSFPVSPKQNTSWVLEISEDYRDTLKLFKEQLQSSREKFRQDSVAWIEGTPIFI